MNKELVAFFCIGLILTLPLSFAAETDKAIEGLKPEAKPLPSPSDFEERETGESIFVEAKSYEPRILVSSAIEQDDVPVFVFLAGSSLGSLTGPEFVTEGRLTVVNQGDVFYGVPPIKNVRIGERDFDSKYIRSITYKPPKNRLYSMDNLGFLIVNLKKIPKENDVPNIIDANITARIEFDMERSYGIGRQTLILGEEPDEKAFLKKTDLRDNMAFSGNVYVRAVKIQDDSADLMVYDTALKGLGSRTNVKIGQISSPITLRNTHSNLIQDQFRVQVDSIVDPQRAYAEAEVSIDGSLPEKKVLYKGSTLSPGSSLKVSDLIKSVSGQEATESLRIAGPSGVAVATRKYTDKSNVLSSELDKDFKQKAGKAKTLTLKEIFKASNFNFGFSSNSSKNFAGKKPEITPPAPDMSYEYNSRSSPYTTDQVEPVNTNIKFDLSALKQDEDYPLTGFASVKNLAGVISMLRLSPEISIEETGDQKTITIKIFKTKDIKVVDVCSPTDTLFSKNAYFDSTVKNKFDEFFRDDEFLSKYEKKRLLCSAIEVFKKVASSYNDEKAGDNEAYGPKAYYMVAQCYEELAKLGKDVQVNSDIASKNALDYYKRAQSAGYSPKDQNIYNKIEDLGSRIISGEEYSDAVIDDNAHEVTIHLLQLVDKNNAQLDATARISIDNGKETIFKTGESLFPGESNGMSDCRIKEIRSTSVIIENCPKHDKDGKQQSNTYLPDITLKENGLTNIEKFKVMLLGTDLHKQVSVTVLPGSGKSFFSESNFLLHIPVEKRAVKFNTDKIDDKIAKTDAQIKKLDGIITQLDKLIKSWKAVCLATFAYLTLKNSFGIFGGGASRVRAREKVMVDSGWRKYCELDSGPGKTYKSYDDCIFEHADKINKNIDVVQKAFDSADKTYKKGDDKMEGLDVKGIREFQKASNEEFYSEQNFKNYVYLKELNDACKSLGDFGKDAKGKPYPNSCTDVSTKYQDTLFDIQTTNSQLSKDIPVFNDKKLNDYTEWKKSHSSSSLSDFNNERAVEIGKIKSDVQFNTFVQRNYNTYSQKKESISADVIKDKDNKYYWQTPYGVVPVEKKGADTFTYKTEAGSIDLKDSTKSAVMEVPDSIDKVKVGYIVWDPKTGKTTGTAYNPGGDSYIVNADKKGNAIIQGGPFKGKPAVTFTEIAMGDTAGLRQTYSPGATYECYEDGKPYCIPLSKGNFVKVLEFYKDGSPKTMNIWNVGSDGRLCNDDDLPASGDSKYGACAHTSSLMSNADCSRTLSEVQSKINSASRYCKAKTVMSSEDGHKFKHSITAASQESYSKAGHCEDAMEINDCKVMFAVCDPVMCPPSRFNLAGNWQVDDVMKTGIIGSVVLGLPNFPNDPVPVCLTGISAGLKNIKSIFESYKNCLTTMKVEGKSVGICDKIRSVYLCQILWQEAIAIFKVKGGLLDIIGKTFGNSAGGGEYLSFSDNFANVEKSVNYFTQSYASSVFAAHKGKSLEEIGTEVCKSAVFGKFPGLGEYFDHLTEPENPTQFTALFDEMPYSETEHKSQYSVYYHIYAGTDQEVQYSVYLKTPANKKYYVTEQCERRNRRIEKGKFADFSITCVTDQGFTKICVEINGKEDCGFGKVSTAFSLNYLNDMVVKDEAQRKITKVEDCVPDSPRTSPSLGSVALPGQVSLLRTGVVRVCSFENPGKGANYKNWQAVGTCLDKDGKSWGSCWMDMSTVDVKYVSDRKDLMDELESRGIEISAQKKGIPESALLKADASKAKIGEAYTLMESRTWPAYINALSILQEVVDLSIDPGSIAEALYNIGVIYYRLAVSPAPNVNDIKNFKTIQSPDTSIPKTSEIKKEDNCYDGLDNDGDGKADCLDQDCEDKQCSEPGKGSRTCRGGTCCDCTSGSCCDGCNFKSSTTVCNTESTSSCEKLLNKDILLTVLTNTYCKGNSKDCDGFQDTKSLTKNCYETGATCEDGNPECIGGVPT